MSENCLLRKSLTVLGGKWNLIIVKTLGAHAYRFGALKRAIPDISEKVLIEKLKLLCEYNLVIRKNFKQIPPKVTYTLSENGLKALEIVEMMEIFAASSLD